MASEEIAVEILKEIRDEIRELRVDSNGRFDEIRDEVHLLRTETAERFGVVETALLDLAATAKRESRLESRVSALESRVDKLESK